MDKLNTLNIKINKAIANIKNQYLSDEENYPWLIGYSGGKDSTCTSQLVFKALIELKEAGFCLKRKVVIYSSDTMIENPLVKEIVNNNIDLINKASEKYNLPVEAYILKPDKAKTFWVNIIGRGYPNPNTNFRWCTDRLKIEPANSFVKKNIDESGEVIILLGVRQGESSTRDRVINSRSIDGENLSRHPSLSNAFVFSPIKDFETADVFMYLNQMVSPWGSNNKELYFFYEESGGGECPLFLSKEDKTSSNSCGNSRLGCWCCTVVESDKSLSGFINTGWHDDLQPLLNFRNWLFSIRDDENYRSFYRMNGSVYTRKVEAKYDDDGKYLLIPKKGKKKEIIIRIDEDGKFSENTNFILLEVDKMSEYLKQNNLSFKNKEMAKIILYDKINDEYSRIGMGPYNEYGRLEILKKLLVAEKLYNEGRKKPVELISDSEIEEIKKLWIKNSFDVEKIDELLSENGRNAVSLVYDSFDINNSMYEEKLKKILSNENLDYEVVNTLIGYEKNLVTKDKRTAMQDIIDSILKADKNNY